MRTIKTYSKGAPFYNVSRDLRSIRAARCQEGRSPRRCTGLAVPNISYLHLTESVGVSGGGGCLELLGSLTRSPVTNYVLGFRGVEPDSFDDAFAEG